jgi:hypothetical protein
MEGKDWLEQQWKYWMGRAQELEQERKSLEGRGKPDAKR